MRRKKLSFVVVGLLVMILLVTACSGSKKDSADMEYNAETSAVDEAAVEQEMDVNTSIEEGDTAGTEDGAAAGSDKGSNTPMNNNQKLIKTFTLDIQTQEYEKLVPTVQKRITELGGYVESSDLEGNGFYDTNQRYAQIVARIPKEKVEEFVNTVSKLGNVVNRNENSKDVTLAYTDTESHQKALKIEQERLLTLLEKAEILEDIITLENRLSDVRYEIESYESQLRMYDNQVDYSTVTLTISEVERMTKVDDETAFDKMKSGLSNSLYEIKTGLVNISIWFVVNIPYLIIWAIIIIIAVVISRRMIKSYKKKYETPNKEDKKEDEDKIIK